MQVTLPEAHAWSPVLIQELDAAGLHRFLDLGECRCVATDLVAEAFHAPDGPGRHLGLLRQFNLAPAQEHPRRS
jgi:hypothetical protein